MHFNSALLVLALVNPVSASAFERT